MYLIKKLPKEAMSEGITLEAVNSPLFKKKCSPAILRQGEEAVALACISTSEKERRYWVVDSRGSYVSDGEKLLVVLEKEARIGRARYLLLHGEQEEREQQERLFALVDAKVEEWKADIGKRLKELYWDLQVAKCRSGAEYENISNGLFDVSRYVSLLNQNYPEPYEQLHKGSRWKEAEAQYGELEKLQREGDLYRLIKIFGKVPSNPGQPIFSAKFDNAAEMQKLKRIFGQEALARWGGDMVKLLAAVAVSKNL
jgi:hypothetical protein